MAYLGVPILQDVSITFYHYSGIVRGSRFVLVCFLFLFCKVRGQARKRWRVGERKKAFLSLVVFVPNITTNHAITYSNNREVNISRNNSEICITFISPG